MMSLIQRGYGQPQPTSETAPGRTPILCCATMRAHYFEGFGMRAGAASRLQPATPTQNTHTNATDTNASTNADKGCSVPTTQQTHG